MRFISRSGTEGEPSADVVLNAIDCFEKNGESGPHSPRGWILSHVLNHCVTTGVPFSMVFAPNGGFYLKRGMVNNVAPDVILKTLMNP